MRVFYSIVRADVCFYVYLMQGEYDCGLDNEHFSWSKQMGKLVQNMVEPANGRAVVCNGSGRAWSTCEALKQ